MIDPWALECGIFEICYNKLWLLAFLICPSIWLANPCLFSLGRLKLLANPAWTAQKMQPIQQDIIRLRGRIMYRNCCVVWWICLSIRADSYQAPNNVLPPWEARLITQSLIACNTAPILKKTKTRLPLICYSLQCARRHLDLSAAQRTWQGVVGHDSSCNQLGQYRLADRGNINGKWRRLRLCASLMHCYRSLFPFLSAALTTPARCK